MPEVPRVLEIPARGTSTAVFESNVLCNWAVDVSIVAPASSTSTTVLRAPTCKAKLTAVVWFSSMLTSALVAVAMPGAAAVMLYRPTGTLLIRYSPLELVSVVYFTPVSLLVAVMVAPGTAAPVESVTFPTRTLSRACPNRTADKTVCAAIATQILPLRIVPPSKFW